MKKLAAIFLSLILLASAAPAQSAEVVIQLNEPFFDALLDAMFQNSEPPEFPIARNGGPEGSSGPTGSGACRESIRLQREIGGTRTAVRFRDGRIYAPIAFTGSYNPPLVGCVDFSGYAESTIQLEFDEAKQALVGRATVNNVNLAGTGGIGGSLIARMVQNSIDKKINPINILTMDKISFVVPIQNSGGLRMKATTIKHDISNGTLNVRIVYAFEKV